MKKIIRLSPELLLSLRKNYEGRIPDGMSLFLWDAKGGVIGAVLPEAVKQFLKMPSLEYNAFGEILVLTTINGLEGYVPVRCSCSGGNSWLCRDEVDNYVEF